MIKKNPPILEKDTQKDFSLSFIYTFFLICVKSSTSSVKLGRREHHLRCERVLAKLFKFKPKQKINKRASTTLVQTLFFSSHSFIK